MEKCALPLPVLGSFPETSEPSAVGVHVLAGAKALIVLQCTYAYKEDPEERLLCSCGRIPGYLKGWVAFQRSE